jgi:hypothetical protein
MNKNITLGVILILALSVITATMMVAHNSADATVLKKKSDKVTEHLGIRGVPIAISGDNTYLAWWTNDTGNDEVIFRSSNDGGASFTDKINLSNTTNADSQDVEIAADGDTVIVTWWERNQTAEEPIMRISTDGGETFGSLLLLSANGTIGEAPLE